MPRILDAAPPQGTWRLVESIRQPKFAARDSAKGVVFKNELWISSGYAPGNIHYYDLWHAKEDAQPGRPRWELGAIWEPAVGDPYRPYPEPPEFRIPYEAYSPLVVFHEELWAIGSSIWKSSNGVTWRPVQLDGGERLPPPAEDAHACALNETIFYVHTHLEQDAVVFASKTGSTWDLCNDKPPFGRRAGAVMVAYKGKLWLMGGADVADGKPLIGKNDIWWSGKDIGEIGKDWERVVEHTAWPGRMWPGLAVDEHERIWLVAGCKSHGVNPSPPEEQNLRDLWYSTDGKTWTAQQAGSPFSARHAPTCYIKNSTLFVVGGGHQSHGAYDDVYSLLLPPK